MSIHNCFVYHIWYYIHAKDHASDPYRSMFGWQLVDTCGTNDIKWKYVKLPYYSQISFEALNIVVSDFLCKGYILFERQWTLVIFSK